ncbi:5'-methylthioadenosine/S-adenosylhomocysteine nucleosidase [Sphingomonas sp.]|uniref:5'-methylthioadenosine/S-adenosylhomocysteine nucleosidase n=1 Tax=Sphingomonas sp. TaxID=28214 RepID=UPI003CC5B19D
MPPLPHVNRLGPCRLLFVMATDHEYGPRLRARISPLLTGVGPIEGAAATAAALGALVAAGEIPDAVVSLGSAGSRRLPLGEVYQVSEVSWRDMDASPLGFARGVTPFATFPTVIDLPTPLEGVPTATLSTGADVVVGAAYNAIEADMVDMETYAVARACARFGMPLIGLRGVSDGAAEGERLDWTALLGLLDERLASAVDQLRSSRLLISAEHEPCLSSFERASSG